MGRRNKLFVLSAVAAIASASVLMTSPVEAQGTCYPGPCAGGDAAFTGIDAPARLRVDKRNGVSVSGTQVGQDSTVSTSLHDNRRARIRPRRAEFFVASGDSYSVLFGVTPRVRGKHVLTGCTTAIPEDFNTTNDCGATVVPAR